MTEIIDIIDKLLSEKTINFLDIGSAGGAHPRWKLLKDRVEIFFTEPNSESFEQIKIKNETKFNYAIGEADGKSLLFITRKDECSSVLKPNSNLLNNYPNPERFDIISEQIIDVITIDKFSEIVDKEIHAIKIDVQGAAYQVINSGRNTLLNDTLCVEVETEFSELYSGQHLFSDVFNFMIDCGYKLIDINPIRWKQENNAAVGNEVVFCDALFIKDPDLISHDRDKLIKLCVLLIVYGNFNYSFSLIKKHSLINDFSSILSDLSSLESLTEKFDLAFSDRQHAREIKNFHSQLETVKLHNTDLQASKVELIKKLELSNQENDYLRKKIDDFKRNLDTLRAELSSCAEQNASLREKYNNISGKLNASNTSNSELRGKCEVLQAEVMFLRKKQKLS